MDLATASAPLITSIADIVGVIIYFSIATWYYGMQHGIMALHNASQFYADWPQCRKKNKKEK